MRRRHVVAILGLTAAALTLTAALSHNGTDTLAAQPAAAAETPFVAKPAALPDVKCGGDEKVNDGAGALVGDAKSNGITSAAILNRTVDEAAAAAFTHAPERVWDSVRHSRITKTGFPGGQQIRVMGKDGAVLAAVNIIENSEVGTSYASYKFCAE